MNLDEFFQKKKYENTEPVKWLGGGEDPYVKQSPQEAAAFEKENAAFLKRPQAAPPIISKKEIDVEVPVKEVARPIAPEVEAIADVTPKIDSSRLEEIKAMFKPQVASDLIDVKKVREQAEVLAPQASWGDVALGLIPVAMDAFSGGYGDALDVSGKYYTDKASGLEKRKQTLEDKLMEIEKARAIASAKGASGSSKRFQSKNVYDKDTGKTYFINYDTSMGQYTYPDGSPIPQEKLRTGFAVVPEEYNRRSEVALAAKKEGIDYTPRINPQTGELESIKGGSLAPLPSSQKSGEFNKKQQADIGDMVTEFTKSPAYTESVNSLVIAPTVTSLLNSAQRSNNPNSIAGNSVVLTMIRQAQRVGVASDRDAAAMGGTQQWGESIDRLQNKLLGSGENLTLRDIQELREISEIYKKRSQNLLRDYYEQEKKAYSRRYGLTPEQIDSQLGSKVSPYMSGSEASIKSSSLPEGIEFKNILQYPPKKYPRATVPVEINGDLHWTEPGEWEAVKKQYPNAKRLK